MNGTSPIPSALPHDIKDLVSYDFPWLPYVVGVVLALLVLGLIWLGYTWWMRRQNRPPLASPIDPYQATVGRLTALQAVPPFSRADQEEFFYQLSLGLREIIELVTGFQATGQTIQELRVLLRSKLPLPTAEIEAVIQFLERADWVKFAHAEATADEARAQQAKVLSWVSTLGQRRSLS